MRLLGLDVGSKTVGVAESDPLGWTAQAVEIIPIDEDQEIFGIDRVAELVKARQVTGFVVGLPKNMNNTEGPRVDASRRYGAMLEKRFPDIPVDFQDERLTTVEAHRMLVEEADISRRKQKKVIDELAASLILQNYLDRNGKLTSRLWGMLMNEKNVMDQGEEFTLVDEKGNEELFKEILRFQADDSGKWYICLYPADQENADEVNIEAYELRNPDAQEGEDVELMPIDSDKEWDMVQEVINTFIDDDGNFNA